MKQHMKKSVLVITSFLFVFITFMVGSTVLDVKVAHAAAKKASISTTKMTIPVGKLKNEVYWTDVKTWESDFAQKLTVKNKLDGASYIFTTSDKKIATISKDGGYLTGISAGTATITCKETYKNKTSIIGSCKVTVKKSNLKTYKDFGSDSNNPATSVGEGIYDFNSFYAGYEPFYYVGYRNPSANYTFVSDNENFTMEEVKYDSPKDIKEYTGISYAYGYKYTAKKSGTYTITVNEVYNKKTTKLGSFKVEVKDVYVETEEILIPVGDYTNAFNYLYYTKTNGLYYFIVDGYDNQNPSKNVISLGYDTNLDYANIIIIGQVPGSAKITVREGTINGNIIGVMNVRVYQAPCEDIILEEEELTTFVGDNQFYINYSIEPYDTTDILTIESDNTDILKVEYDETRGILYTPLNAGTANVTFKCGDKTTVCKITVLENR